MPSTDIAAPSASTEPSSIPPPPSGAPAPTGHIFRDAIQSATHITDVPCARNSLLAGIASGAGIGVIRGMSAGPMVAGNWAVATFALISIGSWHLCQKQYADERKKVAKIIESIPKRTLKQQDDKALNDANSTPSS